MIRELDPVVQQQFGLPYFEHYDGPGKHYSSQSPIPAEDIPTMVKAAGLPLDILCSILVVGCASGELVHDLVCLGYNAFGIDISSYALARADSNIEGRLYHMDAERLLIFPEDTFTVTVANMVPHVDPSRMVTWLTELRHISAICVYLRYITKEWAEDYHAKYHSESYRLHIPWAESEEWWAGIFDQASLTIAHRVDDDDCCSRVVLV